MTITSHRNQRPWSSADTQASELANTAFDDSCYLCPGNTRVSGRQNEQYQSIFVFTNDHPAFSPDAPTALTSPPGIYQNARATGTTRVMCYSPHHSTSLAELPLSSHEQVLATWAEQTREMLAQPDIEQVLIFENKGEVIGVSNPHPHCQIYGASFEFKHLEVERLAMEAHRQETDRHLMADIIASETETNSRLVARTDTALSFLPYFSRFPFETFVVPLQAHNYLYELTAAELTGLARVLQETLIRFDNLWRQPFPYMLVLHQAPRHYQGQYHCHIQIHPLMRQPNLQKFLAGVETGGGHFLNDVDPDGAAAQLRALPDKHFAQ